MFFRQILHGDLGCASYLAAEGGVAIVVDPKWDISEYLELARSAGAEIRHILETHHHADHVSGRVRLAEATGAEIHLPADPADADSPGLRDGDVIAVGTAELRVMAAAGHRPEHLAFALADGPGLRPTHLLSGDSLLVGGVARPDLAIDAVDGATALYDTLRRLESLGDDVHVFPAHVGGSLCSSASLSSATASTIGHERRGNHLLSAERSAFVAELSAGAPARPPRVARVVALNMSGATAPQPLAELTSRELSALVASEGSCCVDVRSPDSFDAGHLRGSLNLAPASSGLGNRAGWATAEDEPVVLIAENRAAALDAAARLYAAGVWSLTGTSLVEPSAWIDAGLPVDTAPSLIAAQVAEGLDRDALVLLDVRDGHEWASGHVAGSLHLPLSELGDGAELDLPRDRDFAVACAAGARAALATSILRRRGWSRVARMAGGIGDLASFDCPFVAGF